jgi:elongator complex protein 3 (tRNA carboxymethyluridine synthase)
MPTSNMANAVQEIIDALVLIPSPTHNDANLIKAKVAAKHRLERMPSNAEIIAALQPKEKRKLLKILRRKITRIISGVTVVAVMTKPYPCPQPEPCAYCPGGPAHGVPQSYTGFEPAAMRGQQNQYDPFNQVKSRMDQLTAIGHQVDKVELIVMGGTFPATPPEYQEWFIQRSLDAITKKISSNLTEAKQNAEKSEIRNVGITVETRPDWAKQPHVDAMLNMGVTRVELGVQNPSDKIYKLVGRTHKVKDVKEATRICKDSGLKIVYHLMPGMPGSSPKLDLTAFKRIFTNPDFKPDMIKIYPCLVLEGTKTADWLREGKFTPYTTEEATKVVADLKQSVPRWARVMRVQRDIPAGLITEGVKKSNLRQLVQRELSLRNESCRCIRCREVGHRMPLDNIRPNSEKAKITSTRYEASESEEIFLSAEDSENDVLFGYLRLRIPSAKANRPEITNSPSAIVRELHVYGALVPVGKHSAKAWQHKGFGSALLAEAERMAREDYGLKKLLVISALGTKQYYMRFGYEHDGVYMSKNLVS